MGDKKTIVGWSLVGGGIIAGGFAAFMYWLASEEEWSTGMVLFAAAFTLLAIYLIGYGIKKVVA